MAIPQQLAKMLGLQQGGLNLTPTPERSQLVQLLQQQAASGPKQSMSGIESLNIASKPILAAILARQQEGARQGLRQETAQNISSLLNRPPVADTSIGLIGADAQGNPVDAGVQSGSVERLDSQGRKTSGVIGALVGSQDPVAQQAGLAASGLTTASRVGRTFEGQNGNMWYLDRQTGQPIDSGVPFAESVRYLQNEDGTYSPVLGSNIQPANSNAGTLNEGSLQTASQQAEGASRLATARSSGDLGAQQFDQLFTDARDARNTLRVLGDQMGFIEEGIRSGSLAPARQATARFFDTFLGRKTDEEDLTANTDAYSANAGQLVAQIIKDFGAGTGLSDADREYAAKIAGGAIGVDEFAMKELLRIQAETNYFQAEEYNDTLRRFGDQPGISGIYNEVELTSPFAGYEDVNGEWVEFLPIGTTEVKDGVRWRYRGGGSNRSSSWVQM